MSKWEPGQIVVVEAKDFFRGAKIAIVEGPCRDHDGSTIVRLTNPDNPIPKVCINPQKGDTMVRATK